MSSFLQSIVLKEKGYSALWLQQADRSLRSILGTPSRFLCDTARLTRVPVFFRIHILYNQMAPASYSPHDVHSAFNCYISAARIGR